MTEWVPKHGTRAVYGAGCRCEACTAANAAYHQRPNVKAAQRAYKQRITALARAAKRAGLTPEDGAK